MHNDAQQYVLFSASEFHAEGEGGFWSNMSGWGDINEATRFSKDETSTYMKAMSYAQDAEWLSARAAEALTGVYALRDLEVHQEEVVVGSKVDS